MSTAGDTDINIVINVTTDSLKEANKLAKELATTLKELSGQNAGGDIISKASISQTKELASGVTALKEKLTTLSPASDKAYEALVNLNSASIATKISAVGTGASFTNLVKSLNLTNEQFENLWGTIKNMPSDSWDSLAASIVQSAKSTDSSIAREGTQMQGLMQILTQATGGYDQFAAAIRKAGGSILGEQGMAEQFGKKIGEELVFSPDSSVINMRQTAIRGMMAETENVTKATEKMYAAIDKSTDSMFNAKQADLTSFMKSEAQAVSQAAKQEENLANIRAKNEGKSFTLYNKADLEAQLSDFENIKRRLEEQGSLNLKYGSMASFAPALERISVEENRVAATTTLMNNAILLSPQELSSLSKALNVSEPELRKFSESQRKLSQESEMMKTYMQSTRASIGPLGTAFREIGMQVYWAALGMLFYTMTLSSLANYQYTIKSNTNSLAKSYYNLEKLQRSLNETVAEYGVNSQEAKDANASLLMAQKDQELQQEQLGISLKQQVITNIQGYLTMIPLTINAMYAMIQGMASLNGITQAGITKKMIDATVTNEQAMANNNLTMQQTSSGASYSFTTGVTSSGLGVKTADIAATGGQTAANIGLISTLRQLITLKQLAIPVIGAVLAIGTTLAMNAYAEYEANKQMEELDKNARNLASSFGGATTASKMFSNELNGNGTVSKDAKAARIEVVKLNDELNRLQNNANLDLRSNVKLEEEVISKVGNGSNINLTINVNDPIVREDTDIDTIVDRVYKSLDRELSGAGVRLG